MHLRGSEIALTKSAVAFRNNNLTPNNGFSFEYIERGEDKREFAATRKPSGDVLETNLEVKFSLRNNHINVVPVNSNPFNLKITLNVDGDCRYKVNDKGEFQQWQVLRLALECIFLTQYRQD